MRDPEVLQQTHTRASAIQEADVLLLYPNLGFGHRKGEEEMQLQLLSQSILPCSRRKAPTQSTAIVEPGRRVGGSCRPWEQALNSHSSPHQPPAEESIQL